MRDLLTHQNHALCVYIVVTVECAALLRFFGIRAVIVDFPSTAPVAHPPVPSAGRAAGSKRDSSQLYAAQEEGGLRMTDRVCAWVQRYFTAHRAPTSTAAVSRETPPGAEAVIASEVGTDDAAREAFAPPLYFQHQGHSRTIAGWLWLLQSNQCVRSLRLNLTFTSTLRYRPTPYHIQQRGMPATELDRV
jgi:hypothetical protein